MRTRHYFSDLSQQEAERLLTTLPLHARTPHAFYPYQVGRQSGRILLQPDHRSAEGLRSFLAPCGQVRLEPKGKLLQVALEIDLPQPVRVWTLVWVSFLALVPLLVLWGWASRPDLLTAYTRYVGLIVPVLMLGFTWLVYRLGHRQLAECLWNDLENRLRLRRLG